VAAKVPLPWEQEKTPATQPITETVSQPQRRPVASFNREAPPMIEPALQDNSSSEMAETRLSSISTAAETTFHTQNTAPDLQETRRQRLDVDEDVQSYVETRAQNLNDPVTQAAHRILLEPASPAMVNLTYACLLIPRFDTHHLIGDPAERLTEWVPQLCIAFGWRLEHLAVRPEYLQWVVRVPPSTAPGYVMRIIRQQTSDRLFEYYPRYAKENPSGDFWAPGYLIMGSSQPHPQQLVRDFVRQTRQRQGLAS
jgi:REP element-mobilizing transposase RayT